MAFQLPRPFLFQDDRFTTKQDLHYRLKTSSGEVQRALAGFKSTEVETITLPSGAVFEVWPRKLLPKEVKCRIGSSVRRLFCVIKTAPPPEPKPKQTKVKADCPGCGAKMTPNRTVTLNGVSTCWDCNRKIWQGDVRLRDLCGV